MCKTFWCQKLHIYEVFYLFFFSVTFWVLFHRLKLKCFLIAKLIFSSIILLNLPSSFFAGFINLTCGLFAKLSLWSFNVNKQLFPTLISTRLRISLLFKICLPAILIFFLIELFAFFVSFCDCIGKTLLMFFFS